MMGTVYYNLYQLKTTELREMKLKLSSYPMGREINSLKKLVESAFLAGEGDKEIE